MAAPTDMRGVRFAVNVFIGTTVLWLLLREAGKLNPIWAISSMLAATDPDVVQAKKLFHGRAVNGLVGCAVGMVILLIGGTSEWKLPFALSISVLISAYAVKVPTMFRQAPITAAIVVASGLTASTKTHGVELGFLRVGEVMLGCMIGLSITLLTAKYWPTTKLYPWSKAQFSKDTED